MLSALGGLLGGGGETSGAGAPFNVNSGGGNQAIAAIIAVALVAIVALLLLLKKGK